MYNKNSAGRPKSSNPRVICSFRLPSDIVCEIKRRAAEVGISESDVLSDAIKATITVPMQVIECHAAVFPARSKKPSSPKALRPATINLRTPLLKPSGKML